ncbi:carbon storage regulator [Ahniella affigens]|nr:carbon storage regulator [Ahniella affigens]
MLILKRRIEECIQIKVPGQDPILVTILKIVDGHVEVGIDAPRTVEVRRAQKDHTK